MRENIPTAEGSGVEGIHRNACSEHCSCLAACVVERAYWQGCCDHGMESCSSAVGSGTEVESMVLSGWRAVGSFAANWDIAACSFHDHDRWVL